MKKRYIFPVLFATMLCLVLYLTSCGDKESTKTKRTKITVKEDDQGVEVRSEDGSVTIQGNEKTGRIKIKTEEGEDLEVSYNKNQLTDDFPKDVPVYSPAKVTMSQVLREKNAMASLSTQDDTTKVATFYKEAMPKEGWSLEGEMNMGAMIILQGKKGKNLLNISIVKGEEETSITMAVTEDTE